MHVPLTGFTKRYLEAFGLEKILTPEEDAARSLVQLLDFGTKMETFRVDSEYYVVKFNVPEKFVGYFVNELNLDEEFNLKLIGLKRSNTIKNCPGHFFGGAQGCKRIAGGCQDTSG